MSTNKHAIIRYQALNRCFRNPGKRHYIEDLLNACNNALYEFNANAIGIKKRQLYDDIKFMESTQGWSIPLDKIKDGRRAYYRYSDLDFSINNQPLNDVEAEQLKSAILVLSRFKGLPQFEWVNELIPKLDLTFSLHNSNTDIISFDSNAFLKGTEFITPLFQAISNKQVLSITYKSFKAETDVVICFHPYFIKQYNNRWYVFGKDDAYPTIINLALDRIITIDSISKIYNQSDKPNFNNYFEDIIGVTKPLNISPLKITLKALPSLAPYIKTKPLHGSQTRIEDHKDYYIFSIEVIPNYELEKKILSFGEDLQVLQPEPFKEKIKQRLIKQLNNY